MLPWRPSQNHAASEQQQQQHHASGLNLNEGAPAAAGGQQQQQQQQQQPSSPTNVQPQQNANLPPPPIPASSQAASQGWGPGQQQQQANGGNSNSPSLNLSHVLHFLQTEFRKYEQERNEWEIERGEMRARIALLEGERRGNDNARADLLRRVKMLEFALKGERSKYLSLQQSQAANGIPPPKASALRTEDRPPSPSSSSEESGSSHHQRAISGQSNEGQSHPPPQSQESKQQQTLSVPTAQQQPKESATISRPSSALSSVHPQQNQNHLTWAAPTTNVQLSANGLAGAASHNTWNPAIGRDRRGQAKSRDYLKQCLQEISYLTSPAGLNPLADHSAAGVPRPRKTMAHHMPMPASSAMELSTSMFPPPPPPVLDQPAVPSLTTAEDEPQSQSQSQSQPQPQPAAATSGTDYASLPPVSSSSRPPPTPTSPSKELPLMEDSEKAAAAAAAASSSSSSEPLTAIFKPDSAELWKNQLNRAGIAAGLIPDPDAAADNTSRGRSGAEVASSSSSKPEAALDGPPESLEMDDPELDEPASSSATDVHEAGTWKPRRIFRSHLDAVRSVAFGRSSDLTLVSGSDDMTAKVWRLNAHTLSPAVTARQASLPESEPQVTLRGHAAAITGLAVSPTQDMFYSASLDRSVQVWRVPSRDRETYAPFDPNLHVGQLEGHTDAVWDVAVLPLRLKDEQLLATASADGCVKLWATSNAASPLKLSWRYNGTAEAEADEANRASLPTPTSLCVCHADLRKVAVAYSNAVIRLFDIESGSLVSSLQSAAEEEKEHPEQKAAQVNSMVAHPTLPLLFAGCDDGAIQTFDTNTAELTATFTAHPDAVTSIDIDGGGLNLVSGGHDGSVRFWDILESRTCTQEIAAHRVKSGEGVLSVKYHPNLPYCASAGADGLVKLYSM